MITSPCIHCRAPYDPVTHKHVTKTECKSCRRELDGYAANDAKLDSLAMEAAKVGAMQAGEWQARALAAERYVEHWKREAARLRDNALAAEAECERLRRELRLDREDAAAERVAIDAAHATLKRNANDAEARVDAVAAECDRLRVDNATLAAIVRALSVGPPDGLVDAWERAHAWTAANPGREAAK